MASAVRMTYHHIHTELARQRAAEIERHPHHQPEPAAARTRDLASLAPVLSVLTGIAGLLAIAAPSL